MAEGEAVQGNTESVADAGVYSDTAQETTVKVETAPDVGVEEATKIATEKSEEVVYDLKPPEGAQLDQEALDAFIPIMKEVGAKPEQAQKLFEIQAGIEKRKLEAHEKAVNDARQSWVKGITEDKELGGEKLKESIHVANQGLEKVATEGFRQLLQQTGLGDHPDVIRVFHKIGKMLGDDEFVQGGPSGQTGVGNFYENSPDLK